MDLNKDEVYLRHIIDEITFLNDKFEKLRFEELMGDNLLQRASIRSLEIIGEAAKNVSDALKAEYPHVDWKKMAGLRDKLIHHYFGVDWDIVWDVVVNKIPDLKIQIMTILEEKFNT